MQLGEKKIGLIPRVLTTGYGGVKEHAILVTDQRSIVVLEKGARTRVAWAIGGAIGSAVAQAMTTRKEVDYSSTNPDILAADKNNTTIPHTAISRIRLTMGFFRGAPKLHIEYAPPNGKTRKFNALLEPPSELMRQRKREGLGRKQVLLEYAAKVRDAYQASLPSSVLSRVEWKT